MISSLRLAYIPLRLKVLVQLGTRPRRRCLIRTHQWVLSRTTWHELDVIMTVYVLTSTRSESYCLSFSPPLFPFLSFSYTWAFRSRTARAASSVGLLISSSSISRAALFLTPLLGFAHIVGFCPCEFHVISRPVNVEKAHVRTLSGRLEPPATLILLPAALSFANCSSFFASSAFRSRNELALTPAALALFVGAMRLES